MNRKHQMEIIGGYYSHLPNFHRNENLSTDNHAVYSINGKPVGLVLDGQESTIEARLYGEEAVVIAQDTYSVRNADIKLKTAVRSSGDGLEDVIFSLDEISMLHQFAGDNKAETLTMLRAVIPQIRDNRTRRIVEQTAEKIGSLSETIYEELTATTRKRCKVENARSIRNRLVRAREQAMESGGKNIDRKREIKRRDR